MEKGKILIQISIFIVAFILFYAGLNVGLNFNQDLGTILLGIFGVLVFGNILWICKAFSRKGK